MTDTDGGKKVHFALEECRRVSTKVLDIEGLEKDKIEQN